MYLRYIISKANFVNRKSDFRHFINMKDYVNSMKDPYGVFSFYLSRKRSNLWFYIPKEKTFFVEKEGELVKVDFKFEDVISRIHDWDKEQYKKDFYAIQNGEIDEVKGFYRIKQFQEDKYTYCKIVQTCRKDKDGNVDLVMCTIRNVEKKMNHIFNENLNMTMLEYSQEAGKVGTYYHDLNTGKMAWSKELYEIFGYEYDKDLNLAQAMRDRIMKEDYVTEEEFFRKYNENPDSCELSYRIKMPDGSIKYCKSSGTLQYDDKGRPIYFISRVVDVTKTQILEDHLEKWDKTFETILEKLPCGVFVRDITDGDKLIFANDKYLRFINLKREDCIGKSSSEYLPPQLNTVRKSDEQDLESIPVGTEQKSMSLLRPKWSEKDRYIEFTKYFYTDKNGHKLVITTAKDNTKLVEAKKKAEEHEKMESAFLANMSHEIRTPLNAIVGFSEYMIECDNINERNEFGKIIKDSNDLLLMLIGDILDLSKLESGTMKFFPTHFDLKEMIENICISYEPKFDNLPISLIKSEDMPSYPIYLDQKRLAQVITNFINNAIKYTHEGYVKVWYDIDEKGVKICVKDTGVGIAKDKKDKVFDRFEKLNSAISGTGLGMSISRMITKTLDGEIGVDSELGKGSTFWCWVPKELKEEV